jgi:hypothetical protein
MNAYKRFIVIGALGLALPAAGRAEITQRQQQQAAQRAYQASAQAHNEVVQGAARLASQVGVVAIGAGKGMIGGAIGSAVTGNPAAFLTGTAAGVVNGVVDAATKDKK